MEPRSPRRAASATGGRRGGRVGVAHWAPPLLATPPGQIAAPPPLCLPPARAGEVGAARRALPGSTPPASRVPLCAAFPAPSPRSRRRRRRAWRAGSEGLRPGARGAGDLSSGRAGWREAGVGFQSRGRRGTERSQLEPRECAQLAPPPVAVRAKRPRGRRTGEEYAARGHPRGGDVMAPSPLNAPSAISNAASICLGYTAETEPSDP